MQFHLTKDSGSSEITVRIFSNIEQIIEAENLRPNEVNFINKLIEKDKKLILLHRMPGLLAFCLIKDNSNNTLEQLRKAGASLFNQVSDLLPADSKIINLTELPDVSLAFLEGFSLKNYSFNKYKSADKVLNLQQNHWKICDKNTNEDELNELSNLIETVLEARNLVNEPANFLTAVTLANRTKELGEMYGFTTEILEKKQIESLRMGGLLSVNLGSEIPPTFTIATYKPENAINNKPFILVGKGVVYDTGGLSLKPTPDSMDIMKCDMGGAATVIATISAVAANKLPIYTIALIPATDNRLNAKAYSPGDIITMFNGKTVEVKNTDAEGRLILADALTYAQRFEPSLVIDVATLTGASVRAIGGYASAFFSTAEEEKNKQMQLASERTFERIMQFPLWNDYFEELKSDVADISNLGKVNAGHISAAKFLEYFTNYPWMHIDIAGPAFIPAENGYLTKGGTGVGVRLLYNFLKAQTKQ